MEVRHSIRAQESNVTGVVPLITDLGGQTCVVWARPEDVERIHAARESEGKNPIDGQPV